MSGIKTLGNFFWRILKAIGGLWKWILAMVIIGGIIYGSIAGYDAYKENQRKKAYDNQVQILEYKLNNFEEPDTIYSTILRVLSFLSITNDDTDITIDTRPYKNVAIENLKKLAEKGYVKAQHSLGLYYSGLNFEKREFENNYSCYWTNEEINLEKANYWYLQAAEKGNSTSMNNLGVSYDRGSGVKEDPLKALYWFRKSYENGNGYGAMNLGDCFRDGIKIQNGTKWIKDPDCYWCNWTHKCSDHTYPTYKVLLEANLDSAIYYWNIAVERGCESAKERLQKIYE